jgi:CTP synthase
MFLKKKRDGEDLGNTIQVIPYITNEIKIFVYSIEVVSHIDIVIAKVCGTICDIEIQPFIESIRKIS